MNKTGNVKNVLLIIVKFVKMNIIVSSVKMDFIKKLMENVNRVLKIAPNVKNRINARFVKRTIIFLMMCVRLNVL